MRLTALAVLLITPLLASQGSAAAPQPSLAIVLPDIVVVGSPKAGEPDFTNSQPMLITGSRIPHRSLQHSPYVASATGFAGLTPDSGLDANKDTVVQRWTTCKVTGAVLSKQTACALAVAQKAMARQDYVAARAAVQGVLARPGLTVEDRHAAQSYAYRIADAVQDVTGKQDALAAMVDTGLMPADEEVAALRTLATEAHRSGRQSEALARYTAIAALLPDDTNSRVNAAVLLQEMGQGDAAKLRLRAAVAVAERTGRPVPQAWLDNLR